MDNKDFYESIFDVDGRDYPKPKSTFTTSEIVLALIVGSAVAYFMLRTIFTFA
jgi:hypothetical protein